MSHAEQDTQILLENPIPSASPRLNCFVSCFLFRSIVVLIVLLMCDHDSVSVFYYSPEHIPLTDGYSRDLISENKLTFYISKY